MLRHHRSSWTEQDKRRRAEWRGREVPCYCCGRVVAYRFPQQYRAPEHGGKARVTHSCPHGVACVAGYAWDGNNWPKGCDACLARARTLYKERTTRTRT